MKVLVITPSDISTGETVTAIHMAERIVEHGGSVRFFASPFTGNILTHQFGGCVHLMGPEPVQNRRTWEELLRTFRPDIILFADYPLLFFGSGTPVLASDAWVQSLTGVDAVLATLDHLGYAQRSQTIYFGPPHLRLAGITVPELPADMHVLLPCPMHEPEDLSDRRGECFRYWDCPLGLTEERRQAVRREQFGDAPHLFVFHSIPTWAWRFAQRHKLPHYQFLPRLLEHYLGDLPLRVVIVSVNNGKLLPQVDSDKIRIVNMSAVPKDRYEELLFAADLMLTDNQVSVGLGKAVCALRPCVVMRNSYSLLELLSQLERPLRQMVVDMESVRLGAIFRFEAFPMWEKQQLDALGLYRHNSIRDCISTVEMFGGEPTGHDFQRLLIDVSAQGQLRSKQQAYIRRVQGLPNAYEILKRLLS